MSIAYTRKTAIYNLNDNLSRICERVKVNNLIFGLFVVHTLKFQTRTSRLYGITRVDSSNSCHVMSKKWKLQRCTDVRDHDTGNKGEEEVE